MIHFSKHTKTMAHAAIKHGHFFRAMSNDVY